MSDPEFAFRRDYQAALEVMADVVQPSNREQTIEDIVAEAAPLIEEWSRDVVDVEADILDRHAAAHTGPAATAEIFLADANRVVEAAERIVWNEWAFMKLIGDSVERPDGPSENGDIVGGQ